jgi:hypothetical protein
MKVTRFYNGSEETKDIDEQQIPWDYPPCPDGAMVKVLGRATEGDVEYLTNVDGIVVSCDFIEDIGNTYSVSIGGKLYSGINPKMVIPYTIAEQPE